MSQTSSHTNASLTFLVPDPLHKIEKPYECLYEPIDGLKRSNYDVNAVNNISVHDIRPQKGLLSLDRDGFLVADLHSSMALEDYGDIRKLKEIYAEELRGFLTELLGARAVYFHETLVSLSESFD
ncbi:hypothetical protein MMC19_004999 [Ptychographa xylographoides]|nr:hypothetical protein [Ptychographa xylographoides]